MNWKLPAVLAVGTAAVALILWSLSGNEPGAPSPAGGEAVPVAAQGKQPGPSLQAEGFVDAAAAPARQEVATPLDAGGTVPAPDTVVRGRLVGDGGVAASGVTVVMRTFRMNGEMGIPVPAMGRDRDDGERTKSGKDGRFEIKVATDRGGVISIDEEGRLLQQEHVGFQPSKTPIELGELTVILAAMLAGVVQDERSRPLGAIKIGAHVGDGMFPGRGESSTTSKDDGRFAIGMVRPGKVTVRTASPGFLPGVLELEVKAGEHMKDLVLTLREGRAISGQVVDDRGVAVPKLKVGAMRKEQRPGVSMERFTADEATETDAHGWFTLAGLSGETADVRAWGSGHSAAFERGVAAGTNNLVLTVQRLASITGTLRDRTGKPIAGSRVGATARRGREVMGGLMLEGLDLDLDFPGARGSAVTAADGTFRIDDVPPGAVTVRANGRGHRPAEQRGVNVRPGATTPDVALVADLGATLRATVTDGKGQAVAAAKVRVSPPKQQGGDGAVRMRGIAAHGGDGPVIDTARQGTFGEGTTGEDGIVEIPGLPGGPAVVEATHAELAESHPQALELPAAGQVECRIGLRKGGFAEVTVLDHARSPVAGARFEVKGPLGAEGRDRTASADASGKARVGPLPAGSYQAELVMEPEGENVGGGMFIRYGGGDRTMAASRVTFVIAEDNVVKVDLVRPVLARLFGAVVDASGPASGIEVEVEPVQDGPGEGPPGNRSARSDAEGRYEIANLEPGRYLLRYGRTGQAAKASEELEVPVNTAEVERNLRLRLGKLKVTVRNKADGEPIEGAEVSLVRGGGGQAPRRERRMVMVSMNMSDQGGGETTTMTVGDTRVKTDVDGVAQIADVPAGTWTVLVRGDQHVQVDLPDQDVVEGAVHDCGTVQMEQAGRIRGRVLDKDGRQVAMGMVSYRRADTATEEREPAMGGSFSLRGLRPGKWLLKAQALAMGPGESPFGPEVEVEVQSGKIQTADLPLAPR